MRKKLLALLLVLVISIGLLAGCGTSGSASATPTPASASGAPAETQTPYPTKPIQIIVPYNPGGDTDLYARSLANILTEELGVSVVVSNMPGAGGSIASTYVKDSDPDGYVVYWAHLAPILNSIMGIVDYTYDAFEVACLAVEDSASPFVVNASVYESLDDFVVKAEENPGKLNYGTDIGGLTHLMGLCFADAAGIDLNVVDVGGGSETLTALIAKQIDLACNNYMTVEQYLQSGELRCLGITAEERNPGLPDIPTLKEQGIDLVINKLFGFYFPKGTPDYIVETFSAAVEKAVQSDDFTALCAKCYTQPIYSDREEAVQKLKETYDLFAQFADQVK